MHETNSGPPEIYDRDKLAEILFGPQAAPATEQDHHPLLQPEVEVHHIDVPPPVSPFERLKSQASAPTTPEILRKPKPPGEFFEEIVPWPSEVDLSELLGRPCKIHPPAPTSMTPAAQKL